MQRIIDPTANASLPAPPALTGTTGYFSGGVPGVSAATRVRYWFLNMLQEEVMSVLALAGITADSTATVFNQLATSIQTLIASVPHGVTVIGATGTFTVPAGVTVIDAEVWAGGAGSWASVASSIGPCGGGCGGGGYARKRITGLTPGASIAVTIGAGGRAGTTSLGPSAGGNSSFGAYISATGGGINPLNSVASPSLGGAGGTGSGGDVNLSGGDGGNGQSNQIITGGTIIGNTGGWGGNGPLSGGFINSGTSGNTGRFPGGGASGAGTGPSGVTSYPGAAGAGGQCVVRW
jgi:hypothetical protein